MDMMGMGRPPMGMPPGMGGGMPPMGGMSPDMGMPDEMGGMDIGQILMMLIALLSQMKGGGDMSMGAPTLGSGMGREPMPFGREPMPPMGGMGR